MLFRDRFSAPNKWMEHLDQNVFGVYLFHVFILVGLQGAILNIDLSARVKFAIVSVAGLIISFLNSALLRLVPGVRRIVLFRWLPVLPSRRYAPWPVLVAAEDQSAVYGVQINLEGLRSLHSGLVLACYLTALFNQSEYRVFHEGIMDPRALFIR